MLYFYDWSGRKVAIKSVAEVEIAGGKTFGFYPVTDSGDGLLHVHGLPLSRYKTKQDLIEALEAIDE